MNIRRLLVVAFLFTAGSSPAHSHGSYHELAEDLRARLEVTPSDPDLHLERARLSLEHGEWEEALDAAALLEERRCHLDQLDRIRGKAWLIAGDLPLSRTHLQKSLSFCPSDSVVLRDLGWITRCMGDSQQSAAFYRDAVNATDSLDLDLAVEAAESLAAIGDWAATDALNRTAIATLGPDPLLLKLSVESALHVGEYDRALECTDILVTVSPIPETWKKRRCEILADAGRVEESRQAWRGLLSHIDSMPSLDRGSESIQLIRSQTISALQSEQANP